MLRRVGVRRQWETPLPWENDLTSYLCPKSLVFALPSAPLSPCAHVYFLLGSSPFEAILTTGTLLSFTGLAATNLANEGREQCHGDHLLTVRAFEYSLHYPKQVRLSQGEIDSSGAFSGLRRVFVVQV